MYFYFDYKESLSFHSNRTDLRRNWSVTEGDERTDALLWTTECVYSTAKCKLEHFLYPFVSHAVVPLPLQRGCMIFNYKRFDPFPSAGHVWRRSPTAVSMVKLSPLGLYSNH